MGGGDACLGLVVDVMCVHACMAGRELWGGEELKGNFAWYVSRGGGDVVRERKEGRKEKKSDRA